MPAPSLTRGVFTTGQVAGLCGVCATTAKRWIDEELLPGYCLPNSRERRVRRADLAAFMRARGMPVPPGLRAGRVVLLVGLTGPRRVEGLLADTPGVAFANAADGFEAGRLFTESHPDAVVIDLALGRSEALAMAQSMRALADGRPLLLVGLCCEDEADAAGVTAAGFNEVLFQPVDPRVLARRLTALALAAR